MDHFWCLREFICRKTKVMKAAWQKNKHMSELVKEIKPEFYTILTKQIDSHTETHSRFLLLSIFICLSRQTLKGGEVKLSIMLFRHVRREGSHQCLLSLVSWTWYLCEDSHVEELIREPWKYFETLKKFPRKASYFFSSLRSEGMI